MSTPENVVPEYAFDRSESLAEITATVAESYRLDPEIARLGAEWARDWWYCLRDRGGETLTKEILLEARDVALDGLPVPRDKTENRPTFRAEYAAQEALVLMAGDEGGQLRELLEGKGERIAPDFQRIDYILTSLLDSYRGKSFPYDSDKTRVPQDLRHMPRRPEFQKTPEERTDEDNRKLALFWFHDCYYMRGPNNSNQVTVNLATLYQDHPELFDPRYVVEQNIQQAEVEALLLNYHLPVQHEQISGAWVENNRRLLERYDGDPRKIFDGFGTYEELLLRTQNDGNGAGFMNFQEKMTSMLGYFFMANDIIPYQNIPLPTDFHVARISVSTEMVKFPDAQGEAINFKRLTNFLRKVYFDFSDHHAISMLELCDAVWLYSREACSKSPTNKRSVIGKRAGRATVYAPHLTRLEDATPEQRKAYHDACGQCAFEQECAHDVPSAYYYISGDIHIPLHKLKFPKAAQNELFDPITLKKAKYGIKRDDTHEIDRRERARNRKEARRAAFIRQLAHPAFIGYSEPEHIALSARTIPIKERPAGTLSGKLFALTREEIVRALGHEPDADELEALRPYLNYNPNQS